MEGMDAIEWRGRERVRKGKRRRSVKLRKIEIVMNGSMFNQ